MLRIELVYNDNNFVLMDPFLNTDRRKRFDRSSEIRATVTTESSPLTP